jgi:hypothetical protein
MTEGKGFGISTRFHMESLKEERLSPSEGLEKRQGAGYFFAPLVLSAVHEQTLCAIVQDPIPLLS